MDLSRLALPCVFMLAACEPAPELSCDAGSDDSGSPRALVHAHAWRASEAGDDPLAQHRPAQLHCPAHSWGAEFGVFEVSTADCNYLSVEQPLAAEIRAGDSLRVTTWWAALIAPEPALGHLALFVDGELLWEREVEIPGSAAAFELEFDSPLSAPAGSTVIFHLHNHGQNSWTLAALEHIEASKCEQ